MAQFGALAIVSAATKGVGAVAQWQSGEALKDQAKLEAKQQGIVSREAAIQRREELINALAQQNATFGMSGGLGSPSQAAAVQRNISEFEREDQRAGLADSYRRELTRTRGKNARFASRWGAATSLLSDSTDWWKTYGGSAPGGG